jgi:hypothetical protein
VDVEAWRYALNLSHLECELEPATEPTFGALLHLGGVGPAPRARELAVISQYPSSLILRGSFELMLQYRSNRAIAAHATQAVHFTAKSMTRDTTASSVRRTSPFRGISGPPGVRFSGHRYHLA